MLIRTEAGLNAFHRSRGRLDVRDLDDPEALLKLDRLDKRIAQRSLQRKLDPDAPLFIDYAEHLSAYGDTDRAPVVRDR